MRTVVAHDGPFPQNQPCHMYLTRWRNSLCVILLLFLLTTVNMLLFILRVKQYADRSCWEQVARATGFILNFNCALVVVLILRRMLSWLRSINVGHILPLEQHVSLHKLTGRLVFLLSVIHSVFHIANFALMSEQSGISVVSYLFDTSMGIGWFRGSANLTGLVVLAMLTVMVACSHRLVRKSGCFEVFYWTHLLYIPTWLLLILHAPNFWMWLLVPAFIYAVEVSIKIYRMFGGYGITSVSSAALLPSNVVRLSVNRPFNFHFSPGDFCYLNIPEVAKFEWHPFAISSSTENYDELTFHIRSCGEWTKSLYSKIDASVSTNECRNSSFIADKYTMQTEMCSHNGIIAAAKSTLWPHVTPHPSASNYVTNLCPSPSHPSPYVQTYRLFDSALCTRADHGLYPGRCVRSQPASMRTASRSIVSMKASRHPAHVCQRHTEGYVTAAVPAHHSLCSTVSIASTFNSSTFDVHSWMQMAPLSLSDVQCGQHQCCQNSPQQIAACNNFCKSSESRDIHKIIARDIKWKVALDGPFGTPCTGVFRSQHAVLIAAGIGVTPFASVLHTISDRYNAAHRPCPHCNVPICLDMPHSMLKLKQVDFVWVNRDMRSFEWFLELLYKLRASRSRPGYPMDTFLTVQLYKTSDAPILGEVPLSDEVMQGRPQWDKVFKEINGRKKGRVSVFYCGPPSIASVIRKNTRKYGFSFVKEMF